VFHRNEKPQSGEAIRYQLLERMGRGSAGEVFLGEAFSPQLNERWPVALKVLAQPFPTDDLLQHEARRLRDLRYPRALGPTDVVQLVDPPGSWAVVMDFVPGADLHQIVRVLSHRRDPIPVRAVFQLGAAVLDALAAAHGAPGRPIAHRSLTPADIRLSSRGEVTVVDFAVHRSPTAPHAPWSAPEYWGVERATAQPPGDVYAVAAILLWMLADTGEDTPSYRQDHDEYIETRLLRTNHLLGPQLAGRTATALLRLALSAEPEARPQARALAEALHDVARSMAGEDLSTFAARLVPIAPHYSLSARREPRSDEGRSRPLSRLPAGIPELGLAIAMTMAPLILLVLLALLVFSWSVYLQYVVASTPLPPAPLAAPTPVVAPAPAGFREDPLLPPLPAPVRAEATARGAPAEPASGEGVVDAAQILGSPDSKNP
jgi:serine/threonine protein kinase